jgi:hypothetical protein
MKPFDFINAINRKTNRDLIRGSDNPSLAAKEYDAFLINKGFSMYIDCILAANEMNMRYHLSNEMQNSYYINTIRPGERFKPWPKKEELSEDMKAVMEFYSVGHRKSQEFLKVLTKQQLDLIKIKIIKGGNSNELRSKSTDRGEVI